MMRDELAKMQKGEQAPCISILVPLQDILFQDKKAALLSVEKAIENAEQVLQRMHPGLANQLGASLQELLEQFDNIYDPMAEGAGFYVSPVFSKLMQFPFPVQRRMQIAETFRISELLYLEHYALQYYVLHLTEKEVQCYKVRLDRLEEIKDNKFPLMLQDDREYNRPARSSSYAGQSGLKGFEKDKSILEAVRLKSHYREADTLLSDYLGTSPLIIAGPKKNIACMQEISQHKHNLIGSINGNYSNTIRNELEGRAWAVLKNQIDEKECSYIEMMQEKWQQQSVTGMEAVWKAANEGKGYRLLVEKDYSCPAFLEEKSGKLRLTAPRARHRILMDVVDEIMRIVLDKNGEVIFTANGALQAHHHIALITRYRERASF